MHGDVFLGTSWKLQQDKLDNLLGRTQLQGLFAMEARKCSFSLASLTPC